MKQNENKKPKINTIEKIKEAERELREKTITLILGGFGLVAALAWNEAIKSLFETFFQQSDQLIGQFIYAFAITLIVVIVSMRLRKIIERKEE